MRNQRHYVAAMAILCCGLLTPNVIASDKSRKPPQTVLQAQIIELDRKAGVVSLRTQQLEYRMTMQPASFGGKANVRFSMPQLTLQPVTQDLHLPLAPKATAFGPWGQAVEPCSGHVVSVEMTLVQNRWVVTRMAVHGKLPLSR